MSNSENEVRRKEPGDRALMGAWGLFQFFRVSAFVHTAVPAFVELFACTTDTDERRSVSTTVRVHISLKRGQ